MEAVANGTILVLSGIKKGPCLWLQVPAASEFRKAVTKSNSPSAAECPIDNWVSNVAFRCVSQSVRMLYKYNSKVVHLT